MFGKLFGSNAKKVIRITMIDVDTDEVVDVTDVPVEHLPEEFSPGGKVEGKGKSFTIIEVNPRYAKEYRVTGEVTMKLKDSVSPVRHVNSDDILLTLPTIADALPPLGTDPFSMEGYVNLHEDEWRQIEFISRSQQALVEEELAHVRDIYENHQVNFEGASFGGYKKLHARKLITTPITPGTITWDELKTLLGGKAESLSFSTSGGKPYAFVTNGFSFRAGEAVFYGNIAGGTDVITLCMRAPGEEALCETLKTRYDLLLVDWVQARLAPF